MCWEPRGVPDTARCNWWKVTCLRVTSPHKNVVMETHLGGEIKMYYFQDLTLNASSVLNFRRLRILIFLCLTMFSQLVTTLGIVVSRPDPGWELIVDVALCRGEVRTSVRTRRSLAYSSSNNSSYWIYRVILSLEDPN